MKLSSILTTATFLLGATLIARAAPLTATPWTLVASTEATESSLGVATGGASGRLAIDNTGLGEVFVKVETPLPPTPRGGARGKLVTLHYVKPGESIGHIGVPAGSVVHIVDRRETPTSGPQVGSSGTYCWTSP